MIEEVWKIVMTTVYVPLPHRVIVGAMREGLDVPFSLQLPLFREARLK